MEEPNEPLEVDGTIDLRSYENEETALAGYVRSHNHMDVYEMTEFNKELEQLMLKHKVIKVDVCFDPFKFKDL